MRVSTTLEQVARTTDVRSRGAAALIEAGLPAQTRLHELDDRTVTRTLAEALGRELARLHERLGDVYDGAFVDTATPESVAALVESVRPRPWWTHVLGRGG